MSVLCGREFQLAICSIQLRPQALSQPRADSKNTTEIRQNTNYIDSATHRTVAVCHSTQQRAPLSPPPPHAPRCDTAMPPSDLLPINERTLAYNPARIC